MIRRITILVTALMLALTMALGAAGAAFSEPYTCWDGSKPVNVQGTKQCPPEPGKNDKFTQTESQKGSFNSSHPKQEDCNRPGQTEKCPPGQF